MTSLNVGATNTSNITQAESIIMLKERVAKEYGPIRCTIGAGCSEGSIQQGLLTSNYPVLLQGIQPKCSYPDIMATAIEAIDCQLVENYFTSANPPAVLAREPAVMDQPGATCHAWDDPYGLSKSWISPTLGCYAGTFGGGAQATTPPPWVWTPANPKGQRCSLHDYLGQNAWPHRASDGYLGRPFDNVGVQYGLNALLVGTFTPAEFVDLNQKVGGFDINGNLIPQRMVADPGAVAQAYRGGRISDPNQHANVPIIDLRGSDNYEIQANFRTYQERARLLAANGTVQNQVLWTDGCVLVGCPTDPVGAPDGSLLLMDQWVAAIDTDKSALPQPAKVIKHRPANAIDQCWIGNQAVTDMGVCQATYPHYGTPRTGAGGPQAEDIFKCRLKPLNRLDYSVMPVPFTDAEWSQLQQAFPNGICDWTKRGVDQQHVVPWLSYDVPLGRPLGSPPESASFSGAAGAPRAVLAAAPGGRLAATGLSPTIATIGAVIMLVFSRRRKVSA